MTELIPPGSPEAIQQPFTIPVRPETAQLIASRLGEYIGQDIGALFREPGDTTSHLEALKDKFDNEPYLGLFWDFSSAGKRIDAAMDMVLSGEQLAALSVATLPPGDRDEDGYEIFVSFAEERKRCDTSRAVLEFFDNASAVGGSINQDYVLEHKRFLASHLALVTA